MSETTFMSSQYEIEPRYKKAVRIAARLRAHGIYSRECCRLTPAEWKQLGIAAGVNSPSEETQRVVVEVLGFFEAAAREADEAAAAQAFDLREV